VRHLSARDVLWIWEHGEGRHPLDQALVILAAGYPELPAGELADLSIGERDARLIALRLETLGPVMEGFGACPSCAERVEIDVPGTAVVDGAAAGRPRAAPALDVDGVRLSLRSPTSRDLAAIAGHGSVAEARRALLRRCVAATRDGAPVAPDELPETVAERVAARLAEADPGAEVLLDVTCPRCGHAFQMLFDAASYVWAELAARARRLIRDVHVLSRAYGWREDDILGMSPHRRQAYLAMVDA